MTRKFPYGYLMLLLLCVEVIIALFVRDSFIRPYGGDFLATILVYSTVRTFTKFSLKQALVISLLVSYFVELAQAVDLLSLLGQRSNSVLSTIAGTSFDWGDMLAFTLGALLIYVTEKLFDIPRLLQ